MHIADLQDKEDASFLRMTRKKIGEINPQSVKS